VRFPEALDCMIREQCAVVLDKQFPNLSLVAYFDSEHRLRCETVFMSIPVRLDLFDINSADWERSTLVPKNMYSHW